jgi:hypothetical protein
MKVTRILFLAVSLIIFPVIIESCCMSGSCCGDNPAAKKFTVNNLDLKVMTFTGSAYVDAPQSIKPKEMSFNFKLDVTYIAMQPLIRPTMAAYACDPMPDSSKEKVTAFSVTSDLPLVISDKVTIDAGTDIKSLFSLGQSFEQDFFYFQAFNMVPTFTVATQQDHEFTFRFTLDDGRIFELRSGVHTLLPQ